MEKKTIWEMGRDTVEEYRGKEKYFSYCWNT